MDSTKSRADRQAEADVRRKELMLRWVKMLTDAKDSGLDWKACLQRVANDAEALVRQLPHLRSEIETTLRGLVAKMQQASTRANEQEVTR